MRVLQLTKKFPFPLKDGESIAVHTLAKALGHLGAEVFLLTMNTSKHPVDVACLPADFRAVYHQIEAIPVFNHITVWGAFKNLFQSESYHVTRFISDAYAQALTDLLQQHTFDVIQLETVYLTPYIPIIRQYSKAIIALRAHNVEHEIWERVAETSTGYFKSLYLNFLNKKLKRFEIENSQKVDILLPITARDGAIFAKKGIQTPQIVTPVGLDAADYASTPDAFERPLSIGFIGSLDWIPNQEGLRWFLEHVWPAVHAQMPQVRCHIAGRNAPEWLRQWQQPNIVFEGEVADAIAFTNQHAVMIVPLLSGSGIRIKILEALFLGRVVVTTPLGLEGIDAKDGAEVWIAADAAAFQAHLKYCHQHPEKLAVMGQRARLFAQKHFDTQAIAQYLLDQYQQISVQTADTEGGA